FGGRDRAPATETHRYQRDGGQRKHRGRQHRVAEDAVRIFRARNVGTCAALLCLALLAAPARGQALVSSSCPEGSSGGTALNYGLNPVAGDAVLVFTLDYIGGGTVTNATWSSGTATLTLDSQSATAGKIIVSGVNPAGYNGTF